MTNTYPTTVSVPTTELATGDIVWSHGMRIELRERGSRFDASTGRTVVWFAGLVTNPDDVNPNVVSVSFRTDANHPEYAPGTFWQVQGNELARWAREI